MSGPVSKYVWMNGALLPFEKATLHFMTAGLHYGIGVFEGIRCYETDNGPAIFRLKDHMDRLFASARVLGWRELPWTVEQLTAAVRETVAANGYPECYIRPVIYLADGGWNLTLDTGAAHVGIAVWKWERFLGDDARERGARANTSSYTRHHPNASMTKAKICGNYVNSVLARTESHRLGFEEAIMLDPQGYVAECTGENLFLVRRNVIYTSPSAEVLEGITRDTVITLACDLGYEVVEEPISRDQLYIADEVFVTGTAAEVNALTEIDFRPIGDGKMGDVTRQLQHTFTQLVQGRLPRYSAWLDSVPLAREISAAKHA
ncbi:MAG: branched-chain amino acid transaminase [Terriglobales bacterium]